MVLGPQPALHILVKNKACLLGALLTYFTNITSSRNHYILRPREIEIPLLISHLIRHLLGILIYVNCESTLIWAEVRKCYLLIQITPFQFTLCLSFLLLTLPIYFISTPLIFFTHSTCSTQYLANHTRRAWAALRLSSKLLLYVFNVLHSLVHPLETSVNVYIKSDSLFKDKIYTFLHYLTSWIQKWYSHVA